MTHYSVAVSRLTIEDRNTMDTHHLSTFLRGCALAIHGPRFAQAATLLERQDEALRAIEDAPIEQVRRIAREATQ